MRFSRLFATLSLTILAGCATLSAASVDLPSAAQRRDAAAVRALIEQRANVNAAQADGSTAILWAAHWNDLDLVKALLKAGADPKVRNRFGSSPLSEAAALGNAAMVEALLNAGADAKSLTTDDGETVLMTASRAGNADIVKMLLDRGADVNARESFKGQTALMWAAAERHPAIVKLLLEHGADWHVISYDHETKLPKLSAASSVTPMSRGGLAAIHFAAREGDVETVKIMLEAGVDINQPDVDKASALIVGLMNKQYTFAKFLLDRGADPNLADVLGRTALYAAIDMRNEDYSAMPGRPALDPMPAIDVIKALLDKGADPNAKLTAKLPGRSGMDGGDLSLGEGTTPLMRAARAGDAEVMRMLLAKGADPKATTKEGNTAFMFAAGIGYRDKNTTGTEAQALEAVKVGLEQGADINQTNQRGEMALHGAAGRGADSIVKYLLEHGAAMDAQVLRSNLTPLDYAMGKAVFGQLPVPHPSTVELLQKMGAHEGKDLSKPLPADARKAEN